MLYVFRTKAAGFFIKGLFLILLCAFVFWGVGDIFTGKNFNSQALATVNGTEVRPDFLQQQVASEIQNLRRVYPEMTNQQAYLQGVPQRVLARTVNGMLLDQQVREMGITVGPEQLVRYIQEQAAFKGADGKFSPAAYRNLVQMSGQTPASFENGLRTDLARQILLQTIAAGTNAAPKSLAKVMADYEKEQRQIDSVLIPFAKAPKAAITADRRNDYYSENEARFTEPERRSITRMTLNAGDLAKSIVISDADLRAEYDADTSRFAVPEKRDVTQILLDDEAKAAAIIDDVNGGKDFAAVVKADKTLEATSLGAVTRDDLPTELADAVFTAESDSVIGPINSALGWHVVKIGKITPATIQSFDAVKASLQKELAEKQATDVFVETQNGFTDALSAGTSLEQVALEYKLPLDKIEHIDTQGLQQDGKAATNPPLARPVLQEVFSLGKGEVSAPLDDGNGTVTVVRVDSITESHLAKIADVTDKIDAALMEQDKNDWVNQQANALVEALKKGETLADIAKKNGWKLTKNTVLKRDTPPEAPLSGGIVDGVFGLENIGESFRVTETDGLRLAVWTARVATPDTAPAAAGTTPAILKNFSEDQNLELLEQYSNALRQNAKVTQNDATLQTLFPIDSPDSENGY